MNELLSVVFEESLFYLSKNDDTFMVNLTLHTFISISTKNYLIYFKKKKKKHCTIHFDLKI